MLYAKERFKLVRSWYKEDMTKEVMFNSLLTPEGT